MSSIPTTLSVTTSYDEDVGFDVRRYRNKYAHQVGHICQIFQRLTWKMYTHRCTTIEVTAINYMIMGTVYIFEIYH